MKCFTCEVEFKDDDMVLDNGPHVVHANVSCCWSEYRKKVPKFRYGPLPARRFKPLPSPQLPWWKRIFKCD